MIRLNRLGTDRMLPRRRSKYNAKRCEADGHSFASQAERDEYFRLKLRERAGEITGLTIQVPFLLRVGTVQLKYRSTRYPNGRAAKYIADFVYMERDEMKIIDTKGVCTELYKLKRAIMEAMGYTITEISMRKRARRAT